MSPPARPATSLTPDERRDRWIARLDGFSAAEGDGPLRVVVEQIDDEWFRPQPGFGFRYRPRDQGQDPIVVSSTSLEQTDFASIPRFMSWFVSRNGRHTVAALVHDQLVTPDMDPAERARADDLFLEMMERCEVPPVRRHVMWAAVVAATRWRSGWGPRIAMVLWGALAAVGMTTLVAGLVTGTHLLCVAALVPIVPAALLWGRRFRAGLVAGFALPPVVFPALASFLGYLTYRVVEEVVRRLSALGRRVEVGEVPEPTSYKEM